MITLYNLEQYQSTHILRVLPYGQAQKFCPPFRFRQRFCLGPHVIILRYTLTIKQTL